MVGSAGRCIRDGGNSVNPRERWRRLHNASSDLGSRLLATIETHLSPAGTEHRQADTEPGLPLGAFNPLLPWTADEVCGQWLGVGMMGTLPSSTSFNISLQWRYWDTPR